MDLSSYVVPHPQVAARIVDDAAVVVLADAGELNVLNPVGTRVWELADGSRTVQEIVDEIVAEFDVAAETAAQDVTEFLEELVSTKALLLQRTPVPAVPSAV